MYRLARVRRGRRRVMPSGCGQVAGAAVRPAPLPDPAFAASRAPAGAASGTGPPREVRARRGQAQGEARRGRPCRPQREAVDTLASSAPAPRGPPLRWVCSSAPALPDAASLPPTGEAPQAKSPLSAPQEGPSAGPGPHPLVTGYLPVAPQGGIVSSGFTAKGLISGFKKGQTTQPGRMKAPSSPGPAPLPGGLDHGP